jgi:hypothetical protein
MVFESAFAAPDVVVLLPGLAARIAALLILARLTLLLLLAGRSALLVLLLLLRVPVVVSHRAFSFFTARSRRTMEKRPQTRPVPTAKTPYFRLSSRIRTGFSMICPFM